MTPNRDGHTPFDILVVIASLFINETSSKKLFYKARSCFTRTLRFVILVPFVNLNNY